MAAPTPTTEVLVCLTKVEKLDDARMLGGLWHGASWNFVTWGTLHGAGLALHKVWTWTPKPAFWNSGLIRVLGVASTFMFVSLVWVLFRAQDTQTMETVYRKLLFLDAYGASWYYAPVFVAFG